MVSVHHPNNVKGGDVCACIKKSLLLVINLNNSSLSKCLALEVAISNKKGHVITLYLSAFRTCYEFDYFISDLEKLLINITSFDPHFEILIGDFKAKSK